MDVFAQWPRRAIRASTSLAALIPVLLQAGCRSSSGTAPGPSQPADDCNGPCVDWGDDGGNRGDAKEGVWEGGKESATDQSCVPQPLSDTVPEGWEEYPVMDCQYRFYVPSSREFLPAPLVWEPCTSSIGPLPYECRQIKVDWPSFEPPPYALGGQHSGYVDSNGRVVIQLQKNYEISRGGRLWGQMGLVVEADGPVRQAFWRDYVPKDTGRQITVYGSAIASGKSGWSVDEWIGNHPNRCAALAGDDTLLRPPIFFDRLQSAPDVAIVIPGARFFLENSRQRRVFKWDGTDMGIAAYATSAHSPAQWVGDTLLFALESSPNFRVVRWTEKDGTKILVGSDFEQDYLKGAANPGSDGKDLVWVQGEGRDDDSAAFSSRWIMTSKFTTNPSEIMPRRLTRMPKGVIGTNRLPPPVGCGYLALTYDSGYPKTEEHGLLVVRLSDGVSWKLPSLGPGDGWFPAIAITCDEVFARYSGAGAHLETIRRVRLDSLGPGIPPSE